MIWIDEIAPPSHGSAGWSRHGPMGAELGRGLPGIVLALGRAGLVCDCASFTRAAQAAAQAARSAPRPLGRGVLTSLAGARLVLDPLLTPGWTRDLGPPRKLPMAHRSWWDSKDAAAMAKGNPVPTGQAAQDMVSTWAGRLNGDAWTKSDLAALSAFLLSCPSDTLRTGRAGVLTVVPQAALEPDLADALIVMIDDLLAEGPRGLAPAGPMRLSYADGLAGLVAVLSSLAAGARWSTLGGLPWDKPANGSHAC